MNDVPQWVLVYWCLGDAEPVEGEVQPIHGTSLVFDAEMQIVVIVNNNICNAYENEEEKTSTQRNERKYYAIEM